MRIGWSGLFWIAAGVVAAAAIVWSFMPRPVPVETAEVLRGAFVATVDESGKTRIRDRYIVASPLAGRLMRIELRPGDNLAHHERIASVFPTPAPMLDPRSRREAEERLGAAEAAYERARTLVERAQAEVRQAKSELVRISALAEKGIATVQARERAELAERLADRDFRAAELQEHSTSHEVEQARVMLARYDEGAKPIEKWEITAPVAGSVLKVVQESETVVAPGQPLLELGNPDDLEIIVDVLSTEAVEIQTGAEVSIERWGGAQPLVGRVRRVEPAAFTKISTLGVEEQRVNVLIDVLSPPAERKGLGDGFRVETRITVYSLNDAILVPNGALFRVGDAWNVYVVKNRRAELRPVELIRRSGRMAAVKSGLAPGETVIVYPSDRIEQGVAVEPS